MGVIIEYLNKRKEKWLKNNIKNQMSDMEVTVIQNAAEEKFSLENWIPDAAKRAKQLSLASHVCKFSHPDAKASSVISTCSYENDGYLHSGNVEYELDAFGNAAAVDVFDFLLTMMADGKTVIEHLENDSKEIRFELDLLKVKYDKIRAEFLAIKKDNQEIKTDERVKQVYFPIGDKYHLLSLMTASGILRVLKTRINEIKEEAKLFRNKTDEMQINQFDEIYDLTEIGFGGTKPRNISAFNHLNNGKAFLLSSCPPTISKRKVTRPRHDFFYNTLHVKRFREDFQYLHSLFKSDQNNRETRNKIEKTLHVIVDNVMVSVYNLRELEKEWSSIESHSQLPMAQKIWLDNIYTELRNQNSEWVDEVSLSFARWIIRTYESVVKESSIKVGDGELVFLKSQVESALMQDKGFLE